MIDRAERREEIRLVLEYVKLAISVLGIGTLLFAGLQWMAANKVANETVYQRIASAWTDHLRTILEKPDLRPYLEEGKELSADDPKREAVLALVDLRLDVMDAILTYAAPRWSEGTITGWRNTFASAFRASPALCVRLHENQWNYGLIVPIARDTCRSPR